MRQLEALVRLSEALARLRCSEVITPTYVREVRSFLPHAQVILACSLILQNHPFAGRDAPHAVRIRTSICSPYWSCCWVKAWAFVDARVLAGAAACEEQHHSGGGA